MQEIVNEVLKTEEQAARIVQEAREKASIIKSSVESEINDILKKAKEKAQHIILEEITKARTDSELEYKNAIKEVEEKNKDFLMHNETKFDGIVGKIIQITSSPEFDRE
jgi:vacuolar-type H+-ATPase subunit E/Vma4